MRVSKKSSSSNVAGAIAGTVRSGNEAVLEAIGALAVYRIANALAIASRYLEDDKIELVVKVSNNHTELSSNDHLRVTFTAKGIRKDFAK